MKITLENFLEQYPQIKHQLPAELTKVIDYDSVSQFEVGEDPEVDETIKLACDKINKYFENQAEPKPKAEPDPVAAEPKAKTRKASKTKKTFAGEYVESYSEELKYIKRYLSLNGKSFAEACKSKTNNPKTLLNSLQKAIVEKRIRKTSPFADEIRNMQQSLIAVMRFRPEKMAFSAQTLSHLKKIVNNYKRYSEIEIINKFLKLQGKSNVKAEAEKLIKTIDATTVSTRADSLRDIRASLNNYINDRTETVNHIEESLAGHKLQKPTAELGEALGSDQFMKRVFHPINFTGKYLRLIGKPTAPYRVLLYGRAGGGKSTFALQFAHYLASEHQQKVLYVAKEEGFNYTLQEKIKRLGASHKNLQIIAELPKFSDLKKYDVVVIDSITSCNLEAEDLRRLPKDISFVFVAQCTKDGHFRGSQEILHDVDTEIVIENMRAETRKNRYGGHEAVRVA